MGPVDDATRAALAESLYDSFVRVPVAVLAATRGDAVARAVYLELASRAEWRGPRQVVTAHGPVHLEIGQMCFGRTELAEAIGFPERRTRAAIERLVSAHALVVKTSKLGTVGTLVGLRENVERNQAERPCERPSLGRKASTTKISDQDRPDLLSSFLPEPGHDRRGDRVLDQPCEPGDGAAALAALEVLKRKGAISAPSSRSSEAAPALQILQGGTP